MLQFVVIIQQLLCNERQTPNWHRTRDLRCIPCMDQEGQKLWCSSITSERSSQCSLALCRCEYLPLPGSPGSAQHSTSGTCTRILSFCWRGRCRSLSHSTWLHSCPCHGRCGYKPGQLSQGTLQRKHSTDQGVYFKESQKVHEDKYETSFANISVPSPHPRSSQRNAFNNIKLLSNSQMYPINQVCGWEAVKWTKYFMEPRSTPTVWRCCCAHPWSPCPVVQVAVEEWLPCALLILWGEHQEFSSFLISIRRN